MKLKSAIESVLFVQGEPVALSRLAKIIGAKKDDVQKELGELAAEYRDRGIVLIQNNDEWQFVTNAENKETVEKLMTSELSDDLSRTSLEALTIIAYKGPISRAGIEYIRGVDSTFTLRNLLMRGLVEREESPKDRRSYLYRVSANFMKHIGISAMRDLPHYDEFHKKEIEVRPAGEEKTPEGESGQITDDREGLI